MDTLLKEIKDTGILPGSYFPSRYYPKTWATECPAAVVSTFRDTVDQWADQYPQDVGTAFYAELQRIAAKC